MISAALGRRALLPALAVVTAAIAGQGAAAVGLSEQPSLFDTPGGLKQGLRDAGIELDVWLTNVNQGILSGAGDKTWQSGTKADVIATFDGQRLGLWDGLYVNLHQDVVWGNDANNQRDGSILPVNVVLGFPRLGGDEAETSITVTQVFGPRLSVSAGKFNLLDSAARTPIAGGGGWQTFLHTGLAAPISGITPPYLFGTIVSYKADSFSSTLMIYDPRNAQDNRVITDPFEDGVTASLSLAFPLQLNGMAGSLSVRGVFSSQDGLDFTTLPDILLPPEAQNLSYQDNYLFASVSAQQYLWQDSANPAVGWGVFAQASVSDGNPNSIGWSVLGGIGGTGGLGGRDNDKWGVGFFHYAFSTDLKDGLDALGVTLEDESGVETFYNLAITPWWRVSANLQVINPATDGAPRAVSGAIRTQIKF